MPATETNPTSTHFFLIFCFISISCYCFRTAVKGLITEKIKTGYGNIRIDKRENIFLYWVCVVGLFIFSGIFISFGIGTIFQDFLHF